MVVNPGVKSLKPNDIVLVESFAGPKVHVKLLKRILKPKDGWGVNGWEAELIYQNEIEQLRKSGVPYKKNSKPIVWVFDYHIISKKRKKKKK